MTKTEVLSALQVVSRVFVWVNLTADDGVYFQISKAEMRRGLDKYLGDAGDGFKVRTGQGSTVLFVG